MYVKLRIYATGELSLPCFSVWFFHAVYYTASFDDITFAKKHLLFDYPHTVVRCWSTIKTLYFFSYDQRIESSDAYTQWLILRPSLARHRQSWSHGQPPRTALQRIWKCIRNKKYFVWRRSLFLYPCADDHSIWMHRTRDVQISLNSAKKKKTAE